MALTRPTTLLSILVAATAFPATAAFIYYKFTGDPTLRPFGISKNNLSQGDAPQALLEILVRVDWGRDVVKTTSQADLRQMLGKAMHIYQIDYRVQFRPSSGDNIQIYFIVEHNRIGPYSLSNVAQGIPAALAAFRVMEDR